MKINKYWQHRTWPQNYSVTERTVIRLFPKNPTDMGVNVQNGSNIVGEWWSGSGRLCVGVHWVAFVWTEISSDFFSNLDHRGTSTWVRKVSLKFE